MQSHGMSARLMMQPQTLLYDLPIMPTMSTTKASLRIMDGVLASLSMTMTPSAHLEACSNLVSYGYQRWCWLGCKGTAQRLRQTLASSVDGRRAGEKLWRYHQVASEYHCMASLAICYRATWETSGRPCHMQWLGFHPDGQECLVLGFEHWVHHHLWHLESWCHQHICGPCCPCILGGRR